MSGTALSLANPPPASRAPMNTDALWSGIYWGFGEITIAATTLRTVQNRLPRLQRRLILRSAQLDDPTLHGHPSRFEAVSEYDTWDAQERRLKASRLQADMDLATAARRVNQNYLAMRAKDRAEVIRVVAAFHPEAVPWIKRDEELKRLQVFREVLPIWGGEWNQGHDDCPF